MKESLLILMAVASLTMANYAQAEVLKSQDLTPTPTQFQWEKWDVKIYSLYFTDTVKSFTEQHAASDSIFICLDLTVINIGNRGDTFIPQNDLKIIIGENAFDAADLDERFDYTKNIEPTLTRERKCYFELPKALVKESFVIRFAGLWTHTKDIQVSVSAPTATPTPTPVVEATPPPSVTTQATQLVTPKDKHLDLSKPLWTKKGFLASNDREMLEIAAHIRREDDEAALNLLLVEGAVFLTDNGIAVSWENAGFQSGMSQVRLKGTLGEFWVRDEALTNTPPPEPPPEVVITSTIPMSKKTLEKIEADQAAQAKQQRELFNKQEAEREANGGFSRAPGLTPEQREAAAVRWGEQDAAKRIHGSKPYPQ